MIQRFLSFLCVIVMVFNGNKLVAQSAELNAAIKAIDTEVESIDKHPASDTISIPATDAGVIAAGTIHPNIKGYWHAGKLEKVVTEYLGEAGKKWEAAYYFQDGRLMYLNSEYAIEMDYMGPGFYVVQYRNAHYIQDKKPFYRNYEGTDAQMPALYKDVPAMITYAEAYYSLLTAAHKD